MSTTEMKMKTYLISTERTIAYGLEEAENPDAALNSLADMLGIAHDEMGHCNVYYVPPEFIEAAEGFGPDTPADDPDFAAIVAANQ